MTATPEEIAGELDELANSPIYLAKEAYADDIRAAAALIRAQAERVRVLEEAGEFLMDRLSDFERDGDVRTDDGERDWHGHIAPALSRFCKTLEGEV